MKTIQHPERSHLIIFGYVCNQGVESEGPIFLAVNKDANVSYVFSKIKPNEASGWNIDDRDRVDTSFEFCWLNEFKPTNQRKLLKYVKNTEYKKYALDDLKEKLDKILK